MSVTQFRYIIIPMLTELNIKPKQLKLPLEIETLIPVSDIVYSFCEIVDSIDLSQYVVTTLIR